MNGRQDGCMAMDELMHEGRTDGRTDGRTHGWVCVRVLSVEAKHTTYYRTTFSELKDIPKFRVSGSQDTYSV